MAARRPLPLNYALLEAALIQSRAALQVWSAHFCSPERRPINARETDFFCLRCGRGRLSGDGEVAGSSSCDQLVSLQ